jgi:hypothetical protein
MRLLVLLVALAAGSAPAGASAARPSPTPALPSDNPLRMRPDADRPTEVAAGLYLLNISHISEEDETLDVDGFIFLRWKDPRLAFDPARAGGSTRPYGPDDIWRPEVELVNARGDRTRTVLRLEGAPDGEVHYLERFSATVLSPMHQRSFPFDSAIFYIAIESFRADARQIVFVVDPHLTGRSPDMSTNEWALKGVTGTVVRRVFAPEGQEFSRVLVRIGADRKVEFYVWKVILPLIVIVAMSWSVFWVHPSDLNTQMQVSITSMLAAIAFNFAISGSLPSLAYLTWIDAFIFTCYSIIFLSIVEDMAVHLAWRSRRRTLARRLDRWSRWVFPLAFLLVNVVLALRFLGSRPVAGAEAKPPGQGAIQAVEGRKTRGWYIRVGGAVGIEPDATPAIRNALCGRWSSGQDDPCDCTQPGDSNHGPQAKMT